MMLLHLQEKPTRTAPDIEDDVLAVAQRLALACTAPEYAFSAADMCLLEAVLIDWQRLLGHRQVTDVYPLALAVRNQGQLATFDLRIAPDVVVGATAGYLELIT